MALSFGCVDEGLPIAYQVLDKGVPVLASDGEQVGTVHHVVAAPQQDIFHGLVIAFSTLLLSSQCDTASSLRPNLVFNKDTRRARAEEPRPEGAQTSWPEVCERVIRLAEEYELLANSLEPS